VNILKELILLKTIKTPYTKENNMLYAIFGGFINGFGMGKLDIYTGKILKLNLEK